MFVGVTDRGIELRIQSLILEEGCGRLACRRARVEGRPPIRLLKVSHKESGQVSGESRKADLRLQVEHWPARPESKLAASA
jgi:hypothetical protein